MNVKCDNVDKNIVQLEIEVEAAIFEQAVQKSFKKNAGKFNIPGFRKGKAPRKMVEQYYGEQVFFEDAANQICSESYDEAIEQNNLFPIERPNITIKQIGNGQDFIFTAKVTTKPEVELGQYKGIEVKKEVKVASDEDVENELKTVINKNARLVTVEDRNVVEGDILSINFKGFLNGVAFEGGAAENHTLTIGSNEFIPGFETQLIGMASGEEKTITVTFPTDYKSEDLAGKDADFEVKVNEIKVKELPEVDDEFAKDVSEFDTLEEYKNSIKEKLNVTFSEKSQNKAEEDVIAAVVTNATLEVPEILIKRKIDYYIYDLDVRLRYQGADLAQYMQMLGMNEETLRGHFTAQAENEVRSNLVLEKIAKVEGISASDEEVDIELKAMAVSYKKTFEELKATIPNDELEYIKEKIMFKNTVRFVLNNSIITE